MHASFTPFIHVDGEFMVPSGITIFGVTGGHDRWTTIPVPPSILALPLAAQLAAVPELMSAYRLQYDARVPFFGRLCGFKFVRSDGYFQFDAHGRLGGHEAKPFRRGGCWVELR